MAAKDFKALCVVAVLLLTSAPSRSNNINIEDGCPRENQGCMQCLSRNSDQLERCQQLFFYVSYSTPINRTQIDSYCTGECPILLSTAYYYCDSESTIPELFTQCPSYNVTPSGSFDVDVTYDDNRRSCLPTSSFKCLECIGDRTRDAVRCLQAYLLARYSNSTTLYSSAYCESNCPLVLNSFTWYCGRSSTSEDAYTFCHRRESDAMFCGDLLQTNGNLAAAASLCSGGNCTTFDCGVSIGQFGCCLRQKLGNSCSTVPTCTLNVTGTTQNIVVDDSCTFEAHNCTQCLSRNSDELERCVQLFTFIKESTTVVRSSSVNAQLEEFCLGECPILLMTSDFFCFSRPSPEILQLCPSYNVTPTASVEITAKFDGQNCLAGKDVECFECIASRSPEPTRCLQLYLLASEDTGSDLYINEFCGGNCPLTLATSNWYCSTPPETFFHFCNRTRSGSSGQYCRQLTRNSTAFDVARRDCRNRCTTIECGAAMDQYGCCLSVDGEVNFKCNIPTCSVRTDGTPIILASYSLVTLLSALISSMTI